MSDLASLFPDLVNQLPPRQDYAQRPVGRGRQRRPSPARRRGPSRTLRLLTGIAEVLARIEQALETHAALMLDIGTALERVAAENAVSAHERRQTNEMLLRLTRQHTELRRDLKQTDLHVPLRHSRRRPLG
jgi:hypothetical protein